MKHNPQPIARNRQPEPPRKNSGNLSGSHTSGNYKDIIDTQGNRQSRENSNLNKANTAASKISNNTNSKNNLKRPHAATIYPASNTPNTCTKPSKSIRGSINPHLGYYEHSRGSINIHNAPTTNTTNTHTNNTTNTSNSRKNIRNSTNTITSAISTNIQLVNSKNIANCNKMNKGLKDPIKEQPTSPTNVKINNYIQNNQQKLHQLLSNHVLKNEAQSKGEIEGEIANERLQVSVVRGGEEQSVLSCYNANLQSNDQQQKVQAPSRKQFAYQYIIGKGGFGKVWKVEHKKNRNQFAMKEMLKSLVMTKKSVQSVLNERLLLSGLRSPFLVNMHYAFQDRDTLYLVLDLLDGGDLRHHLSTRQFSELQAKFFISCIVLGLEYLHTHHIIHRDIKPENLVLDARGYIRITDLGIARLSKPRNSSDTSGTPGYMSPEVICRMNHTYVSDFFALGVIAYELACRKRPYNGVSRSQIRQKMLAKQAHIKVNDLPEDWSPEGVDFINRLLARRPEQRLGAGGIKEIKQHPWIKDINWRKLASKEIESPFIPLMRKHHFDQDEQITIEDEQEADLIEKNSLLLRKPEFQDLFRHYHFHPSQRTDNSHSLAENISPPDATQASKKNAAIKSVRSGRKSEVSHNTVRHSKETILHSSDYNDTINYNRSKNKGEQPSKGSTASSQHRNSKVYEPSFFK